MNILLTGASSFTGYWFAHELAASGHTVVAPLKRSQHEYSGIRGHRVNLLARGAEIRWSCPFGDRDFLELATTGSFDLLCHHAARVADYRNPDFDVCAAFAENTKALPTLLRAMRENGLKAMILTGSVFEPEEGAGSLPLRAFSPYGVSKGVTAALVRYWCDELKIPLGKFVVSNPFGPFEEPRFCAYLFRSWRAGKAAEVRTPRYVRDNIHVSLLAKAYAAFAVATADAKTFIKYSPSGYVETQGTFAQRFANEIKSRFAMECRLVFLNQERFSEPIVRINTDTVQLASWSEVLAWDELAAYYRTAITQ
jgi:UDP-glucose 4-epimerase